MTLEEFTQILHDRYCKSDHNMFCDVGYPNYKERDAWKKWLEYGKKLDKARKSIGLSRSDFLTLIVTIRDQPSIYI